MRVLFIQAGTLGAEIYEDVKKLNLEHLYLSYENIKVLNGALMYYLDSLSYLIDSYDKTVYNQLLQMLENRMIYGQTTILNITGIYEIDNILKLAEIYRYKVVYIFYNENNKYMQMTKKSIGNINNFIPPKVEEKHNTWFNKFRKQQKEYETNLLSAYNKYGKFILNTDTFSKYDDICIIPDLHGCYTVFSKFLEDNNMLQNKNTAYIFLGDYINRGENSTSLIESLVWLSSLENVYLIMGNHDLNLFNWAFGKEYHSSNFEKTVKKLQESKTRKAIENIKKSLCKIAYQFKDYFYFSYNSEKYFLNHAGIEKMRENLPAGYLTGKITYGYFDDKDMYESYIDMCRMWKSNHPDIIQIFAHRNCFPLCLEDNIKINNNAYCLESNVEYGDELITFYLKNKNIKKYNNPAINSKAVKNNIKEIIQEKEFIDHNIKSIIYKKNIFHKNLWNILPVKAKELYRNIDDNTIAARSYDIFFNINEHIDTKLNNWIKNIEYPVKFYKKYNGFLGLVFYNKTTNKLEYAAKSTIDDDKYNNYLKKLLNKEQKNKLKKSAGNMM